VLTDNGPQNNETDGENVLSKNPQNIVFFSGNFGAAKSGITAADADSRRRETGLVWAMNHNIASAVHSRGVDDSRHTCSCNLTLRRPNTGLSVRLATPSRRPSSFLRALKR